LHLSAVPTAQVDADRSQGFKDLLSREPNKALRILSTTLASLCQIFKKLSNSDTSKYQRKKAIFELSIII